MKKFFYFSLNLIIFVFFHLFFVICSNSIFPYFLLLLFFEILFSFRKPLRMINNILPISRNLQHEVLFYIFYPSILLLSQLYLFRLLLVIPQIGYAYLFFLCLIILLCILKKKYIYRLSIITHIIATLTACLTFIKFDTYGFDFYYTPQRISERPVENINGLRKIFYSLNYLSSDKKYFNFQSGKKKYFDPYDFKEIDETNLLVTCRWDKILKINLNDLSFKELNVDTTHCEISSSGKYFYTGNFLRKFEQSNLIKVDLENMKIADNISLKTNELPKTNPFFSYIFDGVRDICIIDGIINVFTFRGRMIQIDEKQKTIIKIKRIFSFIIEGCYNRINKEGFVNTLFYISKIDLNNFNEINFRPSFIVSRSKLNIQRNLLFAVNSLPILGKIIVMNAENFKTLKVFNTSFCRDFAFDDQLKYLFTSNYFSGMVDVIDFNTKKILYSFYAGPLIRAMYFSNKNNKLYIGSSMGIFEFDPTEINIAK